MIIDNYLHLAAMTEYSKILVFSLTPSVTLAVKPNAPINAAMKKGEDFAILLIHILNLRAAINPVEPL